jgi:predicted permease
MSLFVSFKSIVLACLQIFLLGFCGFFLVKKKILSEEGLDALSRLVIELTLPLFIFCQLLQKFNFSLYANWWIFPLLSLAITLLGFIVGLVFSRFNKFQEKEKRQFLSLVTFQNSGYLPLSLIALLLPSAEAEQMFVYLFLFLMGFNLVIWSAGVYLLVSRKTKSWELGSLFSPPVLATLASFLFILLGLNRFMPEFILRPMKMIGDTTVPLAMIVVGGCLAQMPIRNINKQTIFSLFIAKLILLPLVTLIFLTYFKLPRLVGFLILLQAAMPPATSLALITRHYKVEDKLIRQGIFLGHLLSLITIPLFLSLFWMFAI